MHSQGGDKDETCHRKITVDTDVETSNNNHDILTAKPKYLKQLPFL